MGEWNFCPRVCPNAAVATHMAHTLLVVIYYYSANVQKCFLFLARVQLYVCQQRVSLKGPFIKNKIKKCWTNVTSIRPVLTSFAYYSNFLLSWAPSSGHNEVFFWLWYSRKKKKHIMATTPWESHVTSDETRQRWALWRHCAQTGSILHLLKSAFDNMQVTVKGPIYPNCVKCIA